MVGAQIAGAAPGLLAGTGVGVRDKVFPGIDGRVLAYDHAHGIIGIAADPVELFAVVLIKDATEIIGGHTLRMVSNIAVAALVAVGNIHDSDKAAAADHVRDCGGDRNIQRLKRIARDDVQTAAGGIGNDHFDRLGREVKGGFPLLCRGVIIAGGFLLAAGGHQTEKHDHSKCESKKLFHFLLLFMLFLFN